MNPVVCCCLQVCEFAESAQQHASEAAAARAAAEAEVRSHQLLQELSEADAAAQEKLRDLLRCIEGVAAQVRRMACRRGGWMQVGARK